MYFYISYQDIFILKALKSDLFSIALPLDYHLNNRINLLHSLTLPRPQHLHFIKFNIRSFTLTRDLHYHLSSDQVRAVAMMPRKQQEQTEVIRFYPQCTLPKRQANKYRKPPSPVQGPPSSRNRAKKEQVRRSSSG
jgi:hypothetical protein